MIQISAHIEEWPLKETFRIAGNEWRTSVVLVVHLSDGKFVGRGEAKGVFFLGESASDMMDQVENFSEDIRNGISRDELLVEMPAGGARNAVDCALWDLEAKQSGQSIWQLTGIVPKPVTTVFTIGIEDTAEEMARKASKAANYPVLKIKLDANQPLQKLTAIRTARPDAKLVVDANQSWRPELLRKILPECAELGLIMIEQPLPRGDDKALDDMNSSVILAADESCLHSGEIEDVARRYGMINIKLDKTGGLTQALKLAREARALGCQLMVGNMVGSSLSMAPAFVLAQMCNLVDIDGPLLLKHDRPHGLEYTNGTVSSFSSALWG